MKKTAITILLIASFCSCQREKIQTESLEGFVVGYDPCTISQHYRIGYIIISNDLQDTLLSYNISDPDFRMPASILSDKPDTIYKIPERYFENFRNTPFFPDSLRYKYCIKITYLPSEKEELIYNMCYTDIIFLGIKQIIIKSILNDNMCE